MSHATLRARMGVTAASLLAGLSLTLLPAFTSSATASPSLHRVASSPSHSAKAKHQHLTRHQANVRAHQHDVRKVLNEARRQKGKPYQYGAAGPHAFDCSGLVRFVFGKAVHRWLPHNAAEQYHALHHINRSHLQKGDLIFTDNGYISHVGIFAGHHRWWVAPHTGTRVHKQRIYHAHFVYARVLLFNHKH
jgi:cell wall-associated NlpC family hydrolase